MNAVELTESVKSTAAQLGFHLCGICPAVAPTNLQKFDEWLSGGYAGQMHYLADRREAYNHPRAVLDGVRSVIMLALPYSAARAPSIAPGFGRVLALRVGRGGLPRCHS